MNAIAQNSINLQIVLILAFGFVLASILGYCSQRAKFSPILGYLVAGYIIGPYSPGFVADVKMSEQLAEIGVILMMFGVGLHLKWQELSNVKNIAVPGAIIQSFFTAIVGAIFIHYIGWSIEAGIVIGLSIAVASTVVMIRVLSDNHQIATPQGHIAIGWLIVEDLMTVIVLLLLPELASFMQGDNVSLTTISSAIGVALLKCAALLALTVFFGFRVVSYIFAKVARTRSQELFTLTVLGLIFGIATGSAILFGTSIALGAFISGLVIGQTEVRHQASANALPIKDAFSVIFFLSVGMLFNPEAIAENYVLFIGVMLIVLLLKPLVAFAIVIFLKRPFKTALIVAVILAQIGEFSFILSEEATKLGIIPDAGYDIIVACAMLSIAINPILFRGAKQVNKWVDRRRHAASDEQAITPGKNVPRAVIVGFGPIGQDSAKMLEQMGLHPVIIDTNVDTITEQRLANREAVFGDASVEHILEAAHADTAKLLVITTPEIATTLNIILSVRKINTDIPIIARSLYFADKTQLRELDVITICDEEEARQAFIRALLRQRA